MTGETGGFDRAVHTVMHSSAKMAACTAVIRLTGIFPRISARRRDAAERISPTRPKRREPSESSVVHMRAGYARMQVHHGRAMRRPNDLVRTPPDAAKMTHKKKKAR